MASMFNSLINRWNAQSAAAKVRAHPVRGPVLELVESTVNNPKHYLSEIPNEIKADATARIMGEVDKALTQPNPIQGVRNGLAGYVDEVAKFGVLATTPQNAMFKGISGELIPRIGDIAKSDEVVRDYFAGLVPIPSNHEQMIAAVYNIYHHRTLGMRAFELARRILGDGDQDRKQDWFRPYLISHSIFVEYVYRSELGMPSNIEGDQHDGGKPTGFARLQLYSMWPDILLTGEKHPRRVWETRWEDTFGEPSPFSGKDP